MSALSNLFIQRWSESLKVWKFILAVKDNNSHWVVLSCILGLIKLVSDASHILHCSQWSKKVKGSLTTTVPDMNPWRAHRWHCLRFQTALKSEREMPLFLVCVVGVALSLVEGLHPGVEEDDQLFGYFGKGFKKRKTIDYYQPSSKDIGFVLGKIREMHCRKETKNHLLLPSSTLPTK